jgi:hypothetical protein
MISFIALYCVCHVAEGLRDCFWLLLLHSVAEPLALAESKAFAERVRVAEEYFLPFAINALSRTSSMRALSTCCITKARSVSTNWQITPQSSTRVCF